MGCEVHSVAGRFGADYTVGLSGGKRVSGSIGYINNGLYLASYRTPRTGAYDMTVEQASCCGLSAELFNNRWLIGDPIVTRIDAQVDFTWTVNDLLTPTGRDYVSARWVGWMQPTFNEAFELVLEVNDGVRVFFDGELLFDSFEASVEDSSTASDDYSDDNNSDRGSSFSSPSSVPFATYTAVTPLLVADRLYAIKVEFR